VLTKMDKALLSLIVCPLCHAKLEYKIHNDVEELVCNIDKLAFEIKNGVPNMLVNQAKDLSKNQV
jgi:uncharacterized protein YbaR (Trm112 family)